MSYRAQPKSKPESVPSVLVRSINEILAVSKPPAVLNGLTRSSDKYTTLTPKRPSLGGPRGAPYVGTEYLDYAVPSQYVVEKMSRTLEARTVEQDLIGVRLGRGQEDLSVAEATQARAIQEDAAAAALRASMTVTTVTPGAGLRAEMMTANKAEGGHDDMASMITSAKKTPCEDYIGTARHAVTGMYCTILADGHGGWEAAHHVVDAGPGTVLLRCIERQRSLGRDLDTTQVRESVSAALEEINKECYKKKGGAVLSGYVAVPTKKSGYQLHGFWVGDASVYVVQNDLMTKSVSHVATDAPPNDEYHRVIKAGGRVAPGQDMSQINDWYLARWATKAAGRHEKYSGPFFKLFEATTKEKAEEVVRNWTPFRGEMYTKDPNGKVVQPTRSLGESNEGKAPTVIIATPDFLEPLDTSTGSIAVLLVSDGATDVWTALPGMYADGESPKVHETELMEVQRGTTTAYEACQALNASARSLWEGNHYFSTNIFQTGWQEADDIATHVMFLPSSAAEEEGSSSSSMS